MWCTAKEDRIKYVVYTGIHMDYPEWFVDFIRDGYISDDYCSHIYASEEGDVAIVKGDVFLLNNRMDIMYMERTRFEREFSICY